jgi:hypothetical protein
MLTKHFRWNDSIRSIAVVVLLFGVGLFQSDGVARAAQKPQATAASDQLSFYSTTAAMESDSGTPVGPPKSIIICHNGRTIRVSEKAAAAHFAHGDTPGPCPGKYVICHQYPNFDPSHTKSRYGTIIVSQQDYQKYIDAGDTAGPCPNQVFMCTLGGKQTVVAAANVSAHEARGQQVGLCPGKLLICYKNHTIVINESDWPKYQSKGACQGYCYGSSGPLVDQTSPCSSASPTVRASQ